MLLCGSGEAKKTGGLYGITCTECAPWTSTASGVVISPVLDATDCARLRGVNCSRGFRFSPLHNDECNTVHVTGARLWSDKPWPLVCAEKKCQHFYGPLGSRGCSPSRQREPIPSVPPTFFFTHLFSVYTLEGPSPHRYLLSCGQSPGNCHFKPHIS